MTDPYSTFDTFTVGSESDSTTPEPEVPSIIARLPRIAAAPKSKTHQRFDDPEPPLPAAHLAEATTPFDPTAPSGSTTAIPTTTGDPIATIRIDTVTPTAFQSSAPGQAAQDGLLGGGPATIPFQPAKTLSPASAPQAAPIVTTGEHPIDEPWTAWMLDLEATIQPYARWIALAAVIAAMGLTIVLLRGGGKVEATDTAPRVQIDGQTTQVLAEADQVEPAPQYWPASLPKTIDQPAAGDRGLRPLNTVATATPPPVAAGPASASRGPARARLTGEVLAPEAQRVDVADATYDATNAGSRR